MWSRSNRSRMGSNARTDQNQGGGEKKAGFPHMIGREHFTSLFIIDKPLSFLRMTKLPLANPSRPIGSDVRNVYFNRQLPGRA